MFVLRQKKLPQGVPSESADGNRGQKVTQGEEHRKEDYFDEKVPISDDQLFTAGNLELLFTRPSLLNQPGLKGILGYAATTS